MRKEDYSLTLAWRSNNEIYEGFYQQSLAHKGLVWEDHVKWNESRNADWRRFIVIYDNRPVGVVTMSDLDHWCPEVGLYIGEVSLWGKGIGTKMLQKALEWIKEYSLSHAYIVGCRTTILNANIAAVKVFIKCGFKRTADARKGESWYQCMFGES